MIYIYIYIAGYIVRQVKVRRWARLTAVNRAIHIMLTYEREGVLL